MVYKLLTALFVMMLSVSAEAAAPVVNFRLFKENGSVVSNFNKQVKNIIQAAHENKFPMRIEFSNGLSFVAYAVYHGNQNIIFDIGNGRMLRVRITKYQPFYFWNQFINPHAMFDSLKIFKESQEFLKEHKISVPEIYNYPGHEKEFVMMEKINIEFLYKDYFEEDFLKKFSKEEREKMDREFLEFARSTSEFRYIGDFRADQLAYTKDRGWVLIDFSNNHEIDTGTKGNIFEFDRYDELTNKDTMTGNSLREIIQKPGLPDHIRERALQVIERARNGSSNLSCKDLFK